MKNSKICGQSIDIILMHYCISATLLHLQIGKIKIYLKIYLIIIKRYASIKPENMHCKQVIFFNKEVESRV